MIKEVDADLHILVSEEHQENCKKETEKLIARLKMFESIEESGMSAPKFVWNAKITKTE